MPKTLQIFGTAPNMEHVPEIPDAERWGCNNYRPYRARFKPLLSTWTRWFNMHSHGHMTKRYPDGYGWYKKQDGTRPIYLRDGPDPLIPGSIEFPGKLLQEYFGTPGHPETFFTSSLCWLMAFAIYEHLETSPISRIELWGILIRRGSQYDFERPGLHYWIGRARQAGIEVFLPPSMDICVAPGLYGYESHPGYDAT